MAAGSRLMNILHVYMCIYVSKCSSACGVELFLKVSPDF
jgi:hypothetical protein